jgi:predicted dehydrogenase
MTQRIRIGVAGCGSIARHVHLPLLQRRADVEIAAIADADSAARGAAAATLRSVRVFATLDEMLGEAGLDAVLIALPSALHGPAACAVLESGCDLYLEKPLAVDAAEGAAVVSAWRRSGRVGMMGFTARFNPLHRRLRDLIQAGRAGHPVYARSVFSTALRPMPAWRHRRATGGGALLDLGCHHVDLLRFLFDRDVVAVRATLASRCTEDDTALVELELERGPLVHSFFSLAAAEQDTVEVHGDRARLSVSRFTSLDVTVVDNPGPGNNPLRRLARRASGIRRLPEVLRARRAPLREPGFAAALDRFLDAVRTRRLSGDAPDLADGYACLAITEAAERSARVGRVEPVA